MTVPKKSSVSEDTLAGQRRISLLWEGTQSIIAVLISGAIVYCAIKSIDSAVLNNAFFLIVSMYYVRTNHTKIGMTESSTQQVGTVQQGR